MGERLTRRSLRALERRWSKDLARLEAAYPVQNWEGAAPELEVVRNLATAIAEIQMLMGRSDTRP
jgi:hypothetical protein